MMLVMMPRINRLEPRTLTIRSLWSNTAIRLGVLFGSLAFLQGMADPSEGLFAQPTLAILSRSGKSVSMTTDFAAIVALPWVVKPLFGMVSDLLPLFGSRRKNYLILSAVIAIVGFGNVYGALGVPGRSRWFLGWLVLATAGVAFSDVVSDALMVETGQPRGLTGRFQSLQWSGNGVATLLTGFLGGWLSKHHAEKTAVASCVAFAGLLLLLSMIGVREPPPQQALVKKPGEVGKELSRIARMPEFWAVAGLLFLWNLNPFSFQVLRSYMTDQLGLGEQDYGNLLSLFAGACLAASFAYGFYCRRVPMNWLIQASILLGMAQTMVYWGVVGQKSAVVATIFAGLAYMTATLIQLDLAARICPPEVAGTAFAFLLAMENLATVGSVWVGGRIYEWWGVRAGYHAAFAGMVAVGALSTAGCWFLVPVLPPPDRPVRSGAIAKP